MPNWNQNFVEMSAISKDMIERAAKAAKEGNLLQEFIPCPQELLETTAGFMGKDTPEQAALEDQQAENVKKYGYTDWYHWKIANWGTKWDISACEPTVEEDGYSMTLAFDTAWSPPTGAYEKLKALGFTIKAYYYESGMQFAGIWENGVDNYFEGWGDAKGAEAALPKELDEQFAISENQAMWEEECEAEDNTPPALPAP
jgi:hypothetical protein